MRPGEAAPKKGGHVDATTSVLVLADYPFMVFLFEQMPQHDQPPSTKKAISQNNFFLELQRPSAKATSSLVKLPYIHLNKVIFVKGILSDEFTFPPAAIAPSVNMTRP
jgi:hypothetical protein